MKICTSERKNNEKLPTTFCSGTHLVIWAAKLSTWRKLSVSKGIWDMPLAFDVCFWYQHSWINFCALHYFFLIILARHCKSWMFWSQNTSHSQNPAGSNPTSNSITGWRTSNKVIILVFEYAWQVCEKANGKEKQYWASNHYSFISPQKRKKKKKNWYLQDPADWQRDTTEQRKPPAGKTGQLKYSASQLQYARKSHYCYLPPRSKAERNVWNHPVRTFQTGV